MGIAGTAPCTQGKYFRIEFLVLSNGEVPGSAFLTQFTQQHGQRFRHQQRLLAALDLFANTQPGRFLSSEMFKPVEDASGVFEFKAYQHRLFCFYAPGGRLILAFGVIKQRDKHDRKDLLRAQALREEFLKYVK
jgi:hypothetical protein